MSINKIYQFFVAAILLCGANVMLTSCEDILGHWEKPTSDLLKQGIWTEYDEALLTSGKYTAEELAEMPTVGMKIEGDKGYFFTYTADGASDPVEGQVSYNKSTGRGSITFPAIAGNPLSGQYVSFKMTTDETMEFEFTYEGQKTTGTCAWLCENLDNWSSDITDDDWKELMSYYQTISADAGQAPTPALTGVTSMSRWCGTIIKRLLEQKTATLTQKSKRLRMYSRPSSSRTLLGI